MSPDAFSFPCAAVLLIAGGSLVSLSLSPEVAREIGSLENETFLFSRAVSNV